MIRRRKLVIGFVSVSMFMVTASVFAAAAFAQTSPAPAKPPAAATKAADISGKWQFTVQTENGTGSPVVTFKQEADKLSGDYISQTLGNATLTGTIKDKTFDFVVKANVQGTAIDVAFKGTVEADNTLKGTLDIPGLGGGTFTARRP